MTMLLFIVENLMRFLLVPLGLMIDSSMNNNLFLANMAMITYLF